MPLKYLGIFDELQVIWCYQTHDKCHEHDQLVDLQWFKSRSKSTLVFGDKVVRNKTCIKIVKNNFSKHFTTNRTETYWSKVFN